MALSVIIASAKPTQAGIGDCLNAATGAEQFTEAARSAAELAACGSRATADPVMDAAIAIMISLRVGGAFSDTDQCLSLIDSLIGKMVAKALVESGLVNKLGSVLGDDAAKALVAFAQGTATQSFTELVNSVPVLQVLLQYVTCGCKVAGAADEAKQIAETYLKSVKECGETIEKIVEDAAEWCGNAGRDIADALGGAAEEAWSVVENVVDCLTDPTECFSGGDDCAPNRPLPANLWGQPLPRSTYHHGSRLFPDGVPAVFWDLEREGLRGYSKICGAFYCRGGHVITKKLPDGTIVDICSHCPREGEYRVGNLCLPCKQGVTRAVSADGMCSLSYTTTLKADGSACNTLQTSSSCCQPGQRVAIRNQCEPSMKNYCVPLHSQVPDAQSTEPRVAIWGRCEGTCTPPQYFDVAAGACADCKGNTIPVYESDPAVNSRGRCQDCPPDLTRELFTPAPATLVPPKVFTAGICKPCPPGQIIWNFNRPEARRRYEQIARLLPGADAASRAPQTQRVAPGPLPPAEATGPKSPMQHAPGVLPSPGSDTGARDRAAASPTGPIIATKPGECVPCPRNWIPVYDSDRTKSSFGHCEKCPPGTSTDLSPASMVGPAALVPQCRPLNCPGGAYDPKNPHTCLPTFRTAPVIPGDRPTTQPGTVLVPVVPGASPCPPGTRPVGSSCVPVQQPGTQCPPGMIPNPRGPGCIAGGPALGTRPAAPPSTVRPPGQVPTTAPQLRIQ